jgi:hypothetical protein
VSNDTLIARLARELYDLKQKLEDIRKEAEAIYDATQGVSKLEHLKLHAIHIINTIDVTEIYESTD